MFILTTPDMNIENFKFDIDNTIKNLNIITNTYYNKWTVDVSNWHNPAPETNLNYKGYLYQKQRSKLLREFKSIFFNFIRAGPNVLQSNQKFLTADEMRFLLLQPEIKQLFCKYSIEPTTLGPPVPAATQLELRWAGEATLGVTASLPNGKVINNNTPH